MSQKKTYSSYEEMLKGQKGEDFNVDSLSELEKMDAQSEFDAYRKKSLLEETYGTALKSLEDAQKQEQRTAYFEKEKLMKYLPQNLKMQGLGGLGVSGQEYIDANNSYANQLANINRNYNAQKQDLSVTKTNSVSEIEDWLSQKKESNKSEWQQELANRYNNENNVFESLKETLNSKFSEYDKNLDGKHSESEYNAFKEYAEKLYGEGGYTDQRRKEFEAYLGSKNIGVISDSEADRNNMLTGTYGVSVEDAETGAGIENSTAGILDFGDFAGSSRKNSKQSKHVQSIIDMAKAGMVKNGDVYNFNYGAGSASNFVYYDGKWYKTNLSSSVKDKEVATQGKYAQSGGIGYDYNSMSSYDTSNNKNDLEYALSSQISSKLGIDRSAISIESVEQHSNNYYKDGTKWIKNTIYIDKSKLSAEQIAKIRELASSVNAGQGYDKPIQESYDNKFAIKTMDYNNKTGYGLSLATLMNLFS